MCKNYTVKLWSDFQRTVRTPKPKQLLSEPQVQTNYQFEPIIIQWNSWSSLPVFANQLKRSKRNPINQ